MRRGLLLKVETCVRDNAGGDTGEGTKLGLYSGCCRVVEVRGMVMMVVVVVMIVVVMVKEVLVIVGIVTVLRCLFIYWWG